MTHPLGVMVTSATRQSRSVRDSRTGPKVRRGVEAIDASDLRSLRWVVIDVSTLTPRVLDEIRPEPNVSTVTTRAEALDLRVLFPGPDEYPAPARTVHLAQLGRVLTDPAMAPPITWMLVYNLNPVVTMPNQNLVVRGLEREDLFTVVHEQFMTDTARYADLVLPATTQVEHWELMPSWG